MFLRQTYLTPTEAFYGLNWWTNRQLELRRFPNTVTVADQNFKGLVFDSVSLKTRERVMGIHQSSALRSYLQS